MPRPAGSSNKDKPFREALRMEIAAQGDDLKALRTVAKNLIALAQKEDTSAIAAIREIADRLDGKPHQTMEVGEPGDFEHLSDDELQNEALEAAGGLPLSASRRKRTNGHANGTAH